MWCGIYLWEQDIYACVEIGWGLKYDQNINSKFRNRLENMGFEHFVAANDPMYPYEAYCTEKPLSRVIGSSRSFEKQSDSAAFWFTTHAKVLGRTLGSLERLM